MLMIVSCPDGLAPRRKVGYVTQRGCSMVSTVAWEDQWPLGISLFTPESLSPSLSLSVCLRTVAAWIEEAAILAHCFLLAASSAAGSEQGKWR